jgi:hypothetical protein
LANRESSWLRNFGPILDHPPHLALDGGGVSLHLLAAKRGVVQHLGTALGVGVEHHALTEDRGHERVGLGLVQFAVAGAEEELVGFRAAEQNHLFVGQLEPAHIAALVTDALHQADRVGAELLKVAVFFFATGDALYFFEGAAHWFGIPSSPRASFWRSLVSASGASGCSSMFAMKLPRGVSATNVMARARSDARMK